MSEQANDIVLDIIHMVHDLAGDNIIKQRLQDLYNLGYNRGVDYGRNDQRSRDYNSRYGHDMGQ